MRLKIFSLLVLGAYTSVIGVDAHAQLANSDPLTQGMVKLNVKVGVTTQAEILEGFGAPNITTLDASGQEVWVYDRHATVTASSESGFSIGILGGAAGVAVGGGAALGVGKIKSKSETSMRTITLILKFDKNQRVSDFKSRASSF
jgi:hypothetical protein